MVALEPKLNHLLIAKLRRKLLRKLGHDAHKTVDPIITATLDEALDVARRVVRPKGMYRILPALDIAREGVRTAVGTIKSAMFTRLAGMCKGERSIVFMVSTLGKAFESLCDTQTPVYRQLVFDTVGSELAEIVADLVESDWREEAVRLGLQCGMRFSPGYCDWPLEGQGIIAASLDMEGLGVQLTTNFVMLPRKSVSAVAVMAKEVPTPGPCAFCDRDNCSSRRLPKQVTLCSQDKEMTDVR